MSDAANRRRLPVLPRLNDEVIGAAVARITFDALSSGETVDRVAELAFELYRDAVGQAEARIPPSSPRACASGCSYCCHLKVAVSPAEAIRLFEALRASLSAPALDALRARVDATVEKTKGLDSSAHADLRLPCPVLDERGRCLGYGARPMACAGANSYDATRCRAAFQSVTNEDLPIPHYAPERRAAGAARAGLTGALLARRLDGRVLELGAALAILLDDPGARLRWERGERAFEDAIDRELAEDSTPRQEGSNQ